MTDWQTHKTQMHKKSNAGQLHKSSPPLNYNEQQQMIIFTIMQRKKKKEKLLLKKEDWTT